MKHRKTFQWQLWGWPIALGALSLIGLLSALIGDALWDVISWITLGLLVAVCVYFGMGRPPSNGDGH